MKSFRKARLSGIETKRLAAATATVWLLASIMWSLPDLVLEGGLKLRLILLISATFAIGFTLSAMIAVVVHATFQRSLWLAIGIPVLITALFSAGHNYIDLYLSRMALGQHPYWDSEFLALYLHNLGNFILIYFLSTAAIAIVLHYSNARRRERQLAVARMAAQQAQLLAMRLQLNPHFLFNSLNTLSSLVVTGNVEKAERMIGLIVAFLRSSLEADPEEQVTLDRELTTALDYLDIELVRFADRLAVEIECPAGMGDVLVPSHIIQPLVENAIKHGVSRSSDLVTLRISARQTGPRQMEIEVADDAVAAEGSVTPSGTGTGLNNVRRRLDAFYGAEASLISRTGERGFVVLLRLPKLHDTRRELARANVA